MMLRAELRRRLLEERGIYAKECCDKCGQLLGAVRFSRRGEPGVYCSREYRGIVEQPAIRKGGRPRKHASGVVPAQKSLSVSLGVRAFRLWGPRHNSLGSPLLTG